MAAATRERRSIWRVGPESTWTTVLPVLFVIASLVALAVLPVIVGTHTADMRDQITRIAEPSRTAANEIQVGLSAELDKVIAYQVTGESQYRNDYTTILNQQRRDYDAGHFMDGRPGRRAARGPRHLPRGVQHPQDARCGRSNCRDPG